MDSSGACKRLNSKAFVNWVKETPFHILVQTLGTKKTNKTPNTYWQSLRSKESVLSRLQWWQSGSTDLQKKKNNKFCYGRTKHAASMQHWCWVFNAYTYAIFTVFKIGLSPDESSVPLVLSACKSISWLPWVCGTTVDGEGEWGGRETCHADFRCTIYLNSRPIFHTAAFQMHTEGEKKKGRPMEIIERTLLFMLKQMFKVSVGDWRRRNNSSSCEIWLSAVSQSVRWKDQYHSHIWTLNMKLQPAA